MCPSHPAVRGAILPLKRRGRPTRAIAKHLFLASGRRSPVGAIAFLPALGDDRASECDDVSAAMSTGTQSGRCSGYEQAKAELRCIESDESAVAFGPPS